MILLQIEQLHRLRWLQHNFFVVITLLNLKSKLTHKNQFESTLQQTTLKHFKDDGKQILALIMIFISMFSIAYYSNYPHQK
ncbi:unnamed protein product [Paramecium octaurelia]|uniref:Uncharacterized protein n=1 Tax=Paramecium octaurelia TaxID=43137 RepID=A0A8S1X8U1_PAROT|nr:unnamed protein product [Paramecium octaurelia]